MNNKRKVCGPYYRIYRPNELDGGNSYVLNKNYANDIDLLLMAYKILEQDLFKLLQYIEPTDRHKKVFSLKTYELLLRAATEFETNCKKILVSNNYKNCRNRSKRLNWNMDDYRKIEKATKLSKYNIKLNIWNSGGGLSNSKIFKPLASWATRSKKVNWYNEYNIVKHDRSNKFSEAKLINVINAVGSVWAILHAQFGHHIFEPGYHTFSSGFMYQNKLFGIKPFNNWHDNEKYSFEWPNPNINNLFQDFNF